MRDGSADTHLLEPGIIETRYTGHVKAHMAEQVADDLARLLRRHPGAHWLIDATEVDRLEPAKEQSRLAVFKIFEENGGGRIATVVKHAGLRMMSATFSFAFGLRMKSFDDRNAALSYLRSIQS